MRRGSGRGRRARCKNSSRRATLHRELTAWRTLHGKGRAPGQRIRKDKKANNQENQEDPDNKWEDTSDAENEQDVQSQFFQQYQQSLPNGKASSCTGTDACEPDEVYGHVEVEREVIERKLAKLKSGVGPQPQGGAGPFFR